MRGIRTKNDVKRERETRLHATHDKRDDEREERRTRERGIERENR